MGEYEVVAMSRRDESRNYRDFERDVLNKNWAVAKVVRFTDDDIDFLLKQLASPSQNRPAPKKQRIHEKWNTFTGAVSPVAPEKPARPRAELSADYPEVVDAKSEESVTIKKNSVSFAGPFGYSPLFNGHTNDVIFYWDARDCKIQDEYVFYQNATTKDLWWLGNNIAHAQLHPEAYPRAIGLDRIQELHVGRFLNLNFDKKAKEIFDKYYLKAGMVTHHGAKHVARVAYYIPMLVELYKKSGDAEAASLTPEDITLLQFAALLHDAGRKGENVDLWERESAEICKQFFVENGLPEKKAEYYANIILNKDKPHAEKTLLEKIMHDADSLDIIRVRGSFNIEYLDCFQDLAAKEEIRNICIDVANLINDQSDLLNPCFLFEGDTPFFTFTKRNFVSDADTRSKIHEEIFSDIAARKEKLKLAHLPNTHIVTLPKRGLHDCDETLAKQTKKGLKAIGASSDTREARLHAIAVQQYASKKLGIMLPLGIKEKAKQEPMREYSIVQQTEDMAFLEVAPEHVQTENIRINPDQFREELFSRIDEADQNGIKPCHVGHYFLNPENKRLLDERFPQYTQIVDSAIAMTKAVDSGNLAKITETIKLLNCTLKKEDLESILLHSFANARHPHLLLTQKTILDLAASLKMPRLQQYLISNGAGVDTRTEVTATPTLAADKENASIAAAPAPAPPAEQAWRKEASKKVREKDESKRVNIDVKTGKIIPASPPTSSVVATAPEKRRAVVSAKDKSVRVEPPIEAPSTLHR